MKTKILNVENTDYVPEVGEVFTFDGSKKTYIRIGELAGKSFFGHPEEKSKLLVYMIDLDCGGFTYITKVETLIPLEPVRVDNGEIVFQVRK